MLTRNKRAILTYHDTYKKLYEEATGRKPPKSNWFAYLRFLADNHLGHTFEMDESRLATSLFELDEDEAYKLKALVYAENYGIIEYSVSDKAMTYFEKFPLEGVTMKVVLDLTNLEETRQAV